MAHAWPWGPCMAMAPPMTSLHPNFFVFDNLCDGQVGKRRTLTPCPSTSTEPRTISRGEIGDIYSTYLSGVLLCRSSCIIICSKWNLSEPPTRSARSPPPRHATTTRNPHEHKYSIQPVQPQPIDALLIHISRSTISSSLSRPIKHGNEAEAGKGSSEGGGGGYGEAVAGN